MLPRFKDKSSNGGLKPSFFESFGELWTNSLLLFLLGVDLVDPGDVDGDLLLQCLFSGTLKLVSGDVGGVERSDS